MPVEHYTRYITPTAPTTPTHRIDSLVFSNTILANAPKIFCLKLDSSCHEHVLLDFSYGNKFTVSALHSCGVFYFPNCDFRCNVLTTWWSWKDLYICKECSISPALRMVWDSQMSSLRPFMHSECILQQCSNIRCVTNWPHRNSV